MLPSEHVSDDDTLVTSGLPLQNRLMTCSYLMKDYRRPQWREKGIPKALAWLVYEQSTPKLLS